MHSKNTGIHHVATIVAIVLATAGYAERAQAGTIADVDPAEFRFAVEVPETFRLKTGDATLSVSYDSGATKLLEEFQLDLAPTDAPFAKSAPNGWVYVGMLSTTDQARMAKLQDEIARDQDAGQKGNGGVSIEVTGGCFVGSRPDVLPVSTWLQTDANQGYQVVLAGQDLFSMLDAATQTRLLNNLRACN